MRDLKSAQKNNRQHWSLNLTVPIDRNSSSLLFLFPRVNTRIFAYLTGDWLCRERMLLGKERVPPLSTISSRRTFAREHHAAKDLPLLFEPESLKTSDHPASPLLPRARTRAIFLSIPLVPYVTTTEADRQPLSFSRRINPCDENGRFEKFEVSWWDRDPSEAVQLKRFIGQGERGGERYSGWELFDRVWKIDGRRRRGWRRRRWRLTSGEKDVAVVVVGGNRYRF